jgi:hypothetical protein
MAKRLQNFQFLSKPTQNTAFKKIMREEKNTINALIWPIIGVYGAIWDQT